MKLSDWFFRFETIWGPGRKPFFFDSGKSDQMAGSHPAVNGLIGKGISFCLGAILLISGSQAFASCYSFDGPGKKYTGSQVLSFIPVGAVTIDPTVAVGTVLGTIAGDPSVGVFSISCTKQIGAVQVVAPTGQRGSGPFPTNIAGVSAYVTIRESNKRLPYTQVDTTAKNWGIHSEPVTITLRKTGPINAGGTLQGEAYRTYVQAHEFYPYVVRYAGAGVPIVLKKPTCTVNAASKTLNVNLGDQAAAKVFTGIGSASPAQAFDINLTCSGGGTGMTSLVGLVFTDASSPSNTSTTVGLSSTSTAKGIGIQILPKGSTAPIKLGPDSNSWGAVGHWDAGAASNGAFTVGLQARYVQTAAKVTGGSANGLATFTMSYQ